MKLDFSSKGEPEKSSAEKLKKFMDDIRPYVEIVWGKRIKIIKVYAIVIVLILIYLLFIAKPYYTTTITILPDYSTASSLSGLGGLASLAGVKIGEGPPSEIYQNILASESVLGPVINAKYQTERYKDSVDLIRYFDIELENTYSPDVEKRRQFLKAYERFTKQIMKTDLDKLTDILDIIITMPESKLSADVANNVAESLDRYVQTQRKSNATDRRLYLEKRNTQVEDSLRASEDALTTFLDQNKVIMQSPQLLEGQSRLQRKVDLYQTIYLEINQQLELARIDEIKDNPIVNIKENVKEPVIKTGPHRVILFILFAFLAGIFVILFFVYQESMKRYLNLIRLEFKQ